jgi:hypothetical protein
MPEFFNASNLRTRPLFEEYGIVRTVTLRFLYSLQIFYVPEFFPGATHEPHRHRFVFRSRQRRKEKGRRPWGVQITRPKSVCQQDASHPKYFSAGSAFAVRMPALTIDIWYVFQRFTPCTAIVAILRRPAAAVGMRAFLFLLGHGLFSHEFALIFYLPGRSSEAMLYLEFVAVLLFPFRDSSKSAIIALLNAGISSGFRLLIQFLSFTVS